MKKILIIPFHIEKEIPDAKYISEGIIEQLIDLISGYNHLSVLSRSISFYIKENPKSLKELINDLSIDYIIEGNIKQKGINNQLNLRLINATSSEVILSTKDVYKHDEWATFLQKQAIIILEEYKLINHTTEVKKVKGHAKELYLKGMYHWNRYTHKEMLMAIPFFKQSIKADKNYAPAYAGLANCYTVIATMGYENYKKSYENGLKYVKKALLLNDKHSESYLCVSFINLFHQFDYKQAKTNLNFALALNKNNPKTHHTLSFYYCFSREFDLAEKHCLKALELDPLSIPQHNMLIRISQYKRNFAKAQDAINAVLQINDPALPIHQLQGLNYLFTGNLESAIETFKDCIKISNEELLNYGYLSYAYSICNFYSESLSIEQDLDETIYSKENGNYDYAKAVIKFGRKDYAGFFKHINKAINKGLSVLFGDILNNPIYSEIRKDIRYIELLKRGNLNNIETQIETRKPSSLFEIKTNTKENLLLDPQDIAFIQGDGNYCSVNWYNNNILSKTVLRITLKQLETQLRPFSYLIRCHKSYIVNMDKSVKTVGNSKSSFIESPLFSIRIPISRNKFTEIKELMTTH
ncbi:LytTR family transcriptional regulator DNA-binding domain-containing protein [Thalassobellus citreus]|uniref:LytTR family transcriptional regulator DNA-binding domain-containing protein n=1 Tax=Thalassobellus citreus TaxID=3367752 RepID=UPI0037A18456